MRGWWRALPLLLGGAQLTPAYDLDLTSVDSIKNTASQMAADMMSFYNGNEPGNTPGLLPQPYYWWEAGALMGALIDYWYYTGDSQYNNITEQGLLFQVGPNNDYMPPNQTRTEGNDDQGFWALAVMSAAEYNFQDPPADQPQWLALAQAVFNTQAARWETQDCGGGLRWQIFTWNAGFNYKNSISQACFFNLAARLALYTGNQSYADWADKTWDWMRAVKFIDDSYYIYDGAHIDDNCTSITPYQFSYNAGAFLLGAAAMYNQTTGATQDMWRERVDGLINGTKVFFTGNKSNIMTEVACEPVNLCDTDQLSFKAYLSRWMAATTKWAPWTFDRIKPLLQSSAEAAASQCTGGTNGRMCGLKWTNNGKWDGTEGVGQQMAAMEVVLANMIQELTAPVTNGTGGTSQGDPGAGGSDVGRTDPWNILELMGPITTADRAGAYICTVVVLLSLLAGIVFMFLDETSSKTPAERWADCKHLFVAAPGAVALLRKKSARGAGAPPLGFDEKGNDIDRSDSDRSSKVVSFSVVQRNASNTATEDGVPPMVAQEAYAPRHWQKTRRAVVSDPGIRDLRAAAGAPLPPTWSSSSSSSGVTGAAPRRSADGGQLSSSSSHSRSHSTAGSSGRSPPSVQSSHGRSQSMSAATTAKRSSLKKKPLPQRPQYDV